MSAKSINPAMDRAAFAGERFVIECSEAFKEGRGDVSLLPHALNNWVRALTSAGIPKEKIKLALDDASRHSDLN
ncbi:hypothetical protein [Brevundimonas aveniformis]|uniref:hypothetical protein n=1 Tax=Brevundimonas aveniformis TaxID=370977 RepID=UPI00249144AC|nr:hypothetical protein [Brevundimonas aveniformis]